MGNLRTIFRMLLFLLFVLQAGCMQRITRMSDGEEVKFDRMVEEIRDARVVFVGEIHDVEEHHQAQLDIIKALHGSGVPLAIGLEMFPSSTQRDLDQWVEGRLDTGSFRWIFRDNWKEKWWFYSDIFMYAREKRIPLVGLNVPKGIMHKVYTKGFASLTDKEREGLPGEVSCDSGDPYTGLIQRAYAGHSGGSAPFAYFCEAQTLWNKGMALNLKSYLDKHPGKTVVVLAGAGHAMKQGIPGHMAKYGDYFCQVILPDVPGMFAAGVTVLDADYFVE